MDQGSRGMMDMNQAEPERTRVDNLLDTFIVARDGTTEPLRDVAGIALDDAARLVAREGLRLTREVLAYYYGRPLSDVAAEVLGQLETLEAPRSCSVELAVGAFSSAAKPHRLHCLRSTACNNRTPPLTVLVP